MKFTFKLDEEDFLTNLLYTASTSSTVKKRRQKLRFIIPVLYILFGIISFDWIPGLAIAFIVFGILWLLFYPLREKKRYIRSYRKFIKESYSERIGRLCSFEVENDFLLLQEGGSDSRIPVSDVGSITEISTAIIIKLKTGAALLLPKDKITHTDDLKKILKELAGKLTIPYKEAQDWVWK
jgi:hypothetical protein